MVESEYAAPALGHCKRELMNWRLPYLQRSRKAFGKSYQSNIRGIQLNLADMAQTIECIKTFSVVRKQLAEDAKVKDYSS